MVVKAAWPTLHRTFCTYILREGTDGSAVSTTIEQTTQGWKMSVQLVSPEGYTGVAFPYCSVDSNRVLRGEMSAAYKLLSDPHLCGFLNMTHDS